MTASILLGFLTHHYIGSNLNYCNSINSYGTIHNPYVVAMVGISDYKLGFIKGKDSACGDIFGPVSSFKLRDNLDFIAGGYNTNFEEFERLGTKPPSISGITPVLGLNYKIPLTNNINLNNIVSIGIITHAISVDF